MAIVVLVTFTLPVLFQARVEGQLIHPTPPNLLNDYLLSQATDNYPLPGTMGLFYATTAQYAALLRLQQKAIANTMTDHLVSSSDAGAVQSWGRDEALTELWSLFKEAAFAVNRGVATADQQLVNSWLQTVFLRQNVRKAVAAGLEYVKYAGLDHTRYQQIVAGLLQNEANGGASEAYCPSDNSTLTCDDFKALYDFMQTGFTSPNNFAAWTDGTSDATKMATATEGYCAYRSPSPPAGAGSDFPVYPDPNVDNSSFCLSPAPTIGCLFDCNPTPPSVDAFKTWGAMLVSQNLMSGVAAGTTTQDYAATWNRIAASVVLGGVSLVAVGGITSGLLGGLAGFMAVNTSIFTVTASGLSFSAPMYSTVTAAATATASSAAAIVAGVVLFIVGTAIESYQIAMDISVPQKLAHVIQAAARDYRDLTGVFNDENQYGELFSLFVAATAPQPGTNCIKDNTPAEPATCLNPPMPAAASLDDAAFRVWNDAQTADQAIIQNTITWYDKTTQLTNTARLHGTWFVVTSVDQQGQQTQVTYDTGAAGAEQQSLKISYTDWNDVEREAWLLPADSGLSFSSLGLGRGDSTDPKYAWIRSDTVQYVDAAGTKWQAKVASDVAEPPTVAPTWSPNPPFEASPVAFTANGSTAVGTTLFYEWKYQMSEVYVPFLNQWLTCGSPPCYGPKYYGDSPMITFPRSGDFTMLLTATNSVGRTTNYPFTVTVQDVPPTLTLAATCTALVCFPPFNAPFWDPGQTTSLSGTLSHVGSLDTEELTIDWGDGTTSSNTCTPTIGCSPSSNVVFALGYRVPDMAWSGTHKYDAPGVYTVTAKAIEHPGGTASVSMTESVLYKTTLGLSSSAATSVYGQPVTLTATVGTLGTVTGGAVPTGTVTFFDGTATLGTSALSAGRAATLTTSAFTVGSHSLRASYSGDSAFRQATAPAPDPFGFVIPIMQIVNQAPTATAVAASPNPSVFGQPVTFTATVTAVSPGAGKPSGTVDFKDGTATICAQKAVNATGQATCLTSSLAVAGHSITAAYGGDANFTGSTSVVQSQTVNRAGTSTAVGSSKSVSTQGDAVTFTATVTVTAPGVGTPSGTVTFKDGTTTLGSSALGAGGTATFSTSSFSPGMHAITAGYDGDGSFQTSTGQITEYVNTNLGNYPRLPTSAYDLSGLNLAGAYFFSAPLGGASLARGNFTAAVFIGADLTAADMTSANFVGADFTRANLSGANMSASIFKNANFTNANLSGANLTGTSLVGATGLKTATLANVIWSKTTCPDGSVTAKTGGTCIGHLQ